MEKFAIDWRSMDRVAVSEWLKEHADAVDASGSGSSTGNSPMLGRSPLTPTMTPSLVAAMSESLTFL